MLPPCLRGEEKYRVVSVRYCKILFSVVNLEAKKFARYYCLVNALTYVRNASLHLSRECVWLLGAVGVSRIDKLKTSGYASILN